VSLLCTENGVTERLGKLRNRTGTVPPEAELVRGRCTSRKRDAAAAAVEDKRYSVANVNALPNARPTQRIVDEALGDVQT
jgi:hypothetical protein